MCEICEWEGPTMQERYDAANQIPGWSARMDAMLVLMREDPVEYLAVARAHHRREVQTEMLSKYQTNWPWRA